MTIHRRPSTYLKQGAQRPSDLSGGFARDQAQNQHLDSGDMIDLVLKLLSTVQVNPFNPQRFELVNIYSPKADLSYGVQPYQQVSASLNACSYVLTFKLNGITDEQSVIRPTGIRARPNGLRTYRWSAEYLLADEFAPTEFLTVGLTPKQLGVSNIRGRRVISELRYLYTLLQVVTTNWAEHQGKYPENLRIEDYSSLYRRKSLKVYAQQHLKSNAHSTMLRVPVPYWVFCRDIWERYPNLISKKMLTPEAVLYYLIYVHGRAKPRIEAKRGALSEELLHRLGLIRVSRQSPSILRVLKHSLLSLPVAIHAQDFGELMTQHFPFDPSILAVVSGDYSYREFLNNVAAFEKDPMMLKTFWNFREDQLLDFIQRLVWSDTEDA